MVEYADTESLAARLEEVADDLARIEGVDGFGLGLAEGLPVVHVFAIGQIDPTSLRRLDDWFGDQYLVITTEGPAEAQ